MNIFKCANCSNTLSGFIPTNCNCGYNPPIINGVYQFTNDEPIAVDANGPRWLGYEYVGENYRPDYAHNKGLKIAGNYENLANYLGRDKIILDIGAGLGEVSITLALSGLKAIAADISQAMLEAAAKRAQINNAPQDKIIFARMNGYKLQLADNSVDAVFEADALRQVDQPELIVAEILRVLKPNGYFLQYGGKSLGYTTEQEAANIRYDNALTDIENFYEHLISEAGCSEPPFSSWEKAEQCIRENFTEYKTIDDTGAWWRNNIKWPLKLGLHKTKTRASGSKQLIPDDIHNAAWAKTDAYAKSNYGEDYESISRYFNSTSGLKLFTPTPAPQQGN